MSLFTPPSKRDKDYRQISLLLAVPAILVASPLIGYFGGQWLDDWLGTEPWLMTIGVALGLAAAGIEIVGLVRKAASMDKDDHEGSSGT